MASWSVQSNFEAAPTVDLTGLRILVVEDTWHVGEALADMLRLLRAEVSGPVATVAEAEQLISDRVPDLAIVDFTLRGREEADGLVTRLNNLGVHVIVISGREVLPASVTAVAAILKKPFTDSQLVDSLRSSIVRKSSRQ